MASKSYSITNPRHNKSLTKNIYKYDIGSKKYLTSINGKNYSQFSYLNKSRKYAFTPSSWIGAAGVTVSMPTSYNGYIMKIDNKYKTLYEEAKVLLSDIKSSKTSVEEIKTRLHSLEESDYEFIKEDDYNNVGSMVSLKIALTKDIYKYNAGSGNYLTYINGKGYSQFVYLNRTGNYAFTPSSWMKAAGLEVTIPSSSNGYKMKISNPYITKYNNIIKEIKNYI